MRYTRAPPLRQRASLQVTVHPVHAPRKAVPFAPWQGENRARAALLDPGPAAGWALFPHLWRRYD